MERYGQDTRVNDWLATLILCFSFINGVIGINGASMLTTAVIISFCLLSIKRKEFTLYPLAIGVVCFILIWFLISFCRVQDITNTFIYLGYFLAFGFLSFLVGFQDISVDKVIAHMSQVGLAGIITWIVREGHLLYSFSSDDSPHLMGLSYAILPLLFSSIIGLTSNLKTRMICLINIILVVYIYSKVAPRGIWIVVAFFLVSCVFFVLSRIKNTRVRIMTRFIVLSVTLFVGIIVISNFSQFILAVRDYLSATFGLKVYALDKFVMYFKRGNVLNGRGEMWAEAIKYIRENPVFGKGIGFFEAKADGGYSHNIFIQVMCEGGLFIGLPVVLIILRGIGIILSASDKSDRSEYLFFLLTFSCGIIILFYSSVHWIYIPFWFFLGYFLKLLSTNMKNNQIKVKI